MTWWLSDLSPNGGLLFSPDDEPPMTVVSPWEEVTDRASSVEFTEFWRERCVLGTARKP